MARLIPISISDLIFIKAINIGGLKIFIEAMNINGLET